MVTVREAGGLAGAGEWKRNEQTERAKPELVRFVQGLEGRGCPGWGWGNGNGTSEPKFVRFVQGLKAGSVQAGAGNENGTGKARICAFLCTELKGAEAPWQAQATMQVVGAAGTNCCK